MHNNISEGLRTIADPGKNLHLLVKRRLKPYVKTVDELLSEDIEERKYLVEKFIPSNSIGMVFARAGIGKTWFCLCFASAISLGLEKFCGWNIHQAGHVLYIDGETDKKELQARLRQIHGGIRNDKLMVIPSDKLFIEGRPIRIDEWTERDAIDELLEELSREGKRPICIILDNLSCLRSSGRDENSNTDEEEIMGWLNKLRHQGYAVLVVHHAGKNGSQRGASRKEDIMDYIIQLTEPQKGPTQGEFSLSFTKVRAIRPKLDSFDCKLVFDQSGRAQLATSIAVEGWSRKLKILREIEMLSVAGDSVTQAVIVRRLDSSKSSISRDIQDLKIDNLLQRGNLLALTDQGRLALHQAWPDHFKYPAGLDATKQDDCPF